MKKILQNFSGAPLRVLLLIAADLVWICLSLGCVMWSFDAVFKTEFHLIPFWQSGSIAVGMVVINSFGRGYHGSALNPGAVINHIEEIRRMTLSTIGVYLLGTLILLAGGHGNAYLWIPMLISCILTVFFFPAVRFLIRLFMKKMHIGQIRVLIAGEGKLGQSVGLELQTSSFYGFEAVGYLDDNPDEKNPGRIPFKHLGKLSDAERLGAEYGVNYIIVCLPSTILQQALKEYSRSFKHVLVIPTRDILPITAVYPVLIGFISGFDIQNRVLFFFPDLLKTIVEFIGAVLAVICLSPLFLLLALLVKLSSPGPIFYVAKRLGKGGKTIQVFKFRSMYRDAEARLESLLKDNPLLQEEWKKNFKLEHDPRVTPIGDFLRRTSLDELPQFINVIRGEMSIIGPRPIVTGEISYYGSSYDYFKRVKPGITGLWQVSGRSDVDYDQRVAMDMFYVMNWSLWLDMFIFLKTFLIVLSRRGVR